MALGIDFEGFRIPYFQCGNAESDNPDARRCCGIPTMTIDTSLDESDPNQPKNLWDKFKGWVTDKTGEVVFKIIDSTLGKITPDPDRATKFIKKYSLTRKYMCLKGRPQGDDPYADIDDPNVCLCLMPAGLLAYDDPKEVAGRLCRWISTGRPASEQDAGLKEDARCRECVSGYAHTVDGNTIEVGDRLKDGEVDRPSGIWTGLGCVYTDFKSFIEQNLLRWAISLAGFVALLCIAYSAFKMQVSRGNPENIQKARERMTSCILGLLLIIFAVLVLKVIGVDILSLPGFG